MSRNPLAELGGLYIDYFSPTSLSIASVPPSPYETRGQEEDWEKFFRKDLYADLYNESHAAKIWRVAQEFSRSDAMSSTITLNLKGLYCDLAQPISCLKRNGVFLSNKDTLENYPEHVPSEGANTGRYETKPVGFWTCAFLPSCLYALLERSRQFPRSLPLDSISRTSFESELSQLCNTWTAPLHRITLRQNTHDLGFMTQPLRMDWSLTGNRESLSSVVTAANNLASRFSERVKAIRSWDVAVSHIYNLQDKEEDFLIIIDSMCNLDLLFYAGHHSGDSSLIEKAVLHAYVVLRTLVREDGSTCHVVSLDPRSGEIKLQFTHQGYSNSSCWARGQAWAMLGFTQTYLWTRNPVFLHVATSLSNYFIGRLSSLSHKSPFVPPWDFDAPPDSESFVLRDTSAGMIAANALLLLHQALQGKSSYLDAVYRILQDTRQYSMAANEARFELDENEKIIARESNWDAILMHSTANNNEHALVRYSDVGLIYADYYFLELGNKLMRMGMM